MSNSTALIIVDMQQIMEDHSPYRYDELHGTVLELLAGFRSRNLPVIFIQHNGKEGSAIAPNTEGWQLVQGLTPRDNETLIHKEFNSAFRRTILEETLNALGIKELVLCGMQSEYCMDTTIRVAFEKEYSIVLPEIGHSTLDMPHLPAEQIFHHHQEIFRDRFAKILTVDDILSQLDGKS